MAEEIIIKPASDDVYINIIDWQSENVGEDDDRRFIIRFFGRTNTGLSITVSVYNFFPYFFVKVPRSWTSTDIQKFINGMKGMSKDHGVNICKWDLTAWKEFYGFKADKKFNFLMVQFKTSDSMKFYHNRSKDGIIDIRMGYKSEKFQLYESNFDPMLRFMHTQDIKSCGWVKLPKGKYRQDKSLKTYTDYHLRINYDDVESQNKFVDPPKLGMAKFKICSFDLECYSHDEQFPQPDRIEDPIIQIGMVFYTFGEKDMKKYILTLKECDDIEDATVLSYDKEQNLLIDFQRIIQEEDPDILTGYNIYGFDEKYIHGRMKINRVDEFGYISRISTRTEFKENVKMIKKCILQLRFSQIVLTESLSVLSVMVKFFTLMRSMNRLNGRFNLKKKQAALETRL
jgi:DNA polymerase delta subunit 1